MNGRLIGIGALCASVVLSVGTAIVATAGAEPPVSAAACVPRGTTLAEGVPLQVDQWTNAATLVDVGLHEKGLPVRAAVIAVATAMHESALRNDDDLAEADEEDPLGLFGQYPSAGWGAPEQLVDPAHAAALFYERLVTVPDWDTAPPGASARAVQVADDRDGYAAWEPLAEAVVADLTTGCGTSGALSESGWTSPLPGIDVCSDYRTAERPGHDGVDLCAPKGLPIRAAASGVVVEMMCNASTLDGDPYSCDKDGSPSVLGCGWYVDILHVDATVTRYCHMREKPEVVVGQLVKAGQRIGVLGSSGNSSAPHLHFETHTGDPAYPDNATDPTKFFAERGILAW